MTRRATIAITTKELLRFIYYRGILYGKKQEISVGMATRPGKDCNLPDENLMLAILDTYHDFCKGERTTKATRDKRAAATSNEGDEDEGDPKRVEIMRGFLPILLKTLYGADRVGSKYEENLRILTCGRITSVSTVEHSGVELFESLYEDKLKANPSTTEFLTFDDILEAYKQNPDPTNNPLWKKYRDGIHNRVLELSKSGRRFGKGKASVEEEAKELDILASFILNYFFFRDFQNDDRDNYNVYMTFDAGERIVGDIFHDRKKVKCAIFPETLADSATTSLGMLAGRSEYIFPVQDPSQPDRFESNAFTKATNGINYEISFTNRGFSDKNPYGFDLVIAKPDGKKLSLPFSPKQTEGPSVNYIIDILDRAEENAGKPTTERKQYGYILKKGTILSVGEALDKKENEAFRIDLEDTIAKKNASAKTNGLLPDLKRGGDHEAVLASKKAINLVVDGEKKYRHFVFCTIDILCALKSRLEGLNTIWQGKDKIILYRFPTVLPKEVEKTVAIEKGREIVALATKITTFLKIALPSALEAQKLNFEKGKTAVVDFRDREKEHLPTKEACEIALNSLLRIKMAELVDYINSILDLEFIKLTMVQKKELEAIETVYADFRTKSKSELLPLIFFEEDPKNPSLGPQKVYKKGTEVAFIEQDRKKITDLYNLITANVKEKLNLSLNDLDIDTTTGKMTMGYKIQQPATDPSTNIFLMKEHSVFGYNPAVFEKLYDCLLFVHDLTAKNDKRPSRDYNKIIGKILSGDKTAPFDYFSLVNDVVDQFNIQSYRDEIRYILDFRGEKGAKADGSLTREQVEENRKLYFIGKKKNDSDEREDNYDYEKRSNGVVNNISNYFGTLQNMRKFTASLEIEQYEKPTQAGGGPPLPPRVSAIQYYDLNDLLYEVSSTAAAFIESVYSEHYLNKATPTLQEFLEYATQTYTILDEYSPIKINGVQQYDAQGNPKYLEKYLADSIYEDIGVDWQAGLFEVRQNKEYLYDYTGTDDLLSYLLTLRRNEREKIKVNESDSDKDRPFISTLGEEIKFFDSTKGNQIITQPQGLSRAIQLYMATLEIAKGKNSKISVGAILLFVLTLVENVMNPKKKSYFLTGNYRRTQFQSKLYWNTNLFRLINHFFSKVYIAIYKNPSSTITLETATYLSGGSLDTNKTRKVKRSTSRYKTLKH